MNGRLRWFLPRDFKIDETNQEELARIAIQFNSTPRKCLGYRTPKEVLRQHWKRLCRTAYKIRRVAIENIIKNQVLKICYWLQTGSYYNLLISLV